MSVTAGPPGRRASIALVVAKAPAPGRAKTRLAASVGAQAAAALAEALLLDTLDGCRAEADRVGLLCASPDDVAALRDLAGPDAPIVVQDGAGLSAALASGARAGLALARAVLLVSADVPGVPPGALGRAVRLLDGGVDVVLGPGDDGGYWLVALRAEHPGLFDGMAWSTGDVLADTLTRARQLGLAVELVDAWRDVDTAADLAALAAAADALPGRRAAAAIAMLAAADPPTPLDATPSQEVPTR